MGLITLAVVVAGGGASEGGGLSMEKLLPLPRDLRPHPALTSHIRPRCPRAAHAHRLRQLDACSQIASPEVQPNHRHTNTLRVSRISEAM